MGSIAFVFLRSVESIERKLFANLRWLEFITLFDKNDENKSFYVAFQPNENIGK